MPWFGWLYLVALIAGSLLLISYAFRPNKRNHQECLKNIFEMEREMFGHDLPKELYWAQPTKVVLKEGMFWRQHYSNNHYKDWRAEWFKCEDFVSWPS